MSVNIKAAATLVVTAIFRSATFNRHLRNVNSVAVDYRWRLPSAKTIGFRSLGY